MSESTAARILALLCEAPQTVSELRRELGISANAVREHLDRLTAEGLVEHELARGRVGKPGRLYRLTAMGSQRLSRAYAPVLAAVLGAAEAELPGRRARALARAAGRRLAEALGVGEGSGGSAGAARAISVLDRLGGAGRLEQAGGELWILSPCCPVGSVSADHPLACEAMAGLLSAVTGSPIQQRCEHGRPPHCRLRVVPA
jgi:predicted ArsR family transcriptional regulator